MSWAVFLQVLGVGDLFNKKLLEHLKLFIAHLLQHPERLIAQLLYLQVLLTRNPEGGSRDRVACHGVDVRSTSGDARVLQRRLFRDCQGIYARSHRLFDGGLRSCLREGSLFGLNGLSRNKSFSVTKHHSLFCQNKINFIVLLQSFLSLKIAAKPFMNIGFGFQKFLFILVFLKFGHHQHPVD